MRMSIRSTAAVLGVIAIIVGLSLIGVTLVYGSGASNGGSGSGGNRSIEPVEAIDPADKDDAQLRDDEIDFTDPFATSFGAKAKHQVTIRVAANGVANIAVYYRDRKKPKVLAPGSVDTRTITARYPLAAVTIQLPGDKPHVATVATCTIEIDGVVASRKSTRKPWVVRGCIA